MLLERIKQLGRVYKPIHLCWLFRLLHLKVPPYFIGTTDPVFDQESFRFRNDDGSESGASWYALLNTDVNDLDNDTNYRIRINVKEQNTAVGKNEDITFQYSKNSGTWTTLDTLSSNIKAVTSGNFNNLDDSTQQLTTGGFDTTNAAMCETGLCGGATLDPPQDSYVETELCFQIVSADVADGDTIDIRVLFDGALDTWTQVPRITVLVGGTDYTRTITDSVGITDSVARIADLNKTISDNLGITDAISTAGTFIKSIADNIGLTDAITTAVIKLVSIADSVGITDSISKIGTFLKSLSDNEGITDSVSTQGTFLKTLSDNIGITDSISKTGTFFKTLNDSVGITDVISKAIIKFITISDNVGITDEGVETNGLFIIDGEDAGASTPWEFDSIVT